MSTQGSNDSQALPEQLRAAFETYRNEKSAASWTALSQLWVRDNVEVLDAVKLLNPDFPDPLAIPVDGLIEESADFFQWPTLPDPDDVLRAILQVLQNREP